MFKIVYDHQVFSMQRYGGVSRYVYELATHLYKNDDLDVKILAMAYVNEYLKKCNPDLVVGLPVPYIPSYQIQRIMQKFNTELSKIWLKNNYPDILHQTYYYSRNLARSKSIKVVITVYDMIHEKLSEFFTSKDIFQSTNNTSQAKQESIREADHIICISENTKQDLIEILDVEPDKVSVVYLGYSLNLNQNHQFDVGISEPYILYVGDRGGYKNFLRLLQAYASSSQLRKNFKIVCFGQSPLSRDEISLIKALGLPEGKVLQVSGDDVTLANFYRKASVFVYPSLYEGFGLPLLEAMSLQCPVACSNNSSMPEVAGNAAEYFDPYESESIANALEKLLSSPERANNLVKLGTERVKRFSWQACADKTREVYLSVIGESQRTLP